MVDKKLRKAAEELRSKGRGGDTILAHINPQEAEILKMLGGAGSRNPKTGLLEFLNITDEDGNQVASGGALPLAILPPEDAARIAARPWGQSSVGGGFFGGLEARGLADAAPFWAAVAIPLIGAAAGAALIEAGLMPSAASASAAATASGATAAQAAAAGASATASATAVGTAIANTSYQIANGIPADKAVVNSATTAAIQIGTPAAASQIQKTIVSATRNPIVVNTLTTATVGAGQALLQGKNASDAFKQGGQSALIGQVTSQIPGFNNLTNAAKTVVNDAIKAKVNNKDFEPTPEYIWGNVIGAAYQQKTAIDEGWSSHEQKSQAASLGYTDPVRYDDYLVDKEFAKQQSEYVPKTLPSDFVGPMLPGDIVDSTLTNIVSSPSTDTRIGDYTFTGTKEGITATMPETLVTGTEPIDYTLNTIAGGDGLTLPTSPNLDIMGGGQGLTTAVTGGVLSETGVTPTGNVTLGDLTSVINTGEPVSKNKTYTYDDGSTITVDENENIVSYTEATDTTYTGPVETPSKPLTQSQVEGLIKLGLGVYGASKVANVVRDAISSGGEEPQGGFPFTPSDISGWARPEYTKTWQAPIDLNSLFTTDNLLGGTQWAGLQGNQFANIPQVSMSDFISSIQNGKV